MALTTITQGRFTSNGTATTIQMESGIDWMKVYNYTVAAASQTTAVGVEYYWQRGFPSGYGWEYKKSNAANAANLSAIITTNGFTYVDTSVESARLGVLHTDVTAVSNATIPVVTETATNGLSAGNVVRLTNIAGAQQLSGMDFTVGYNTLTSNTFSLDYMAQIVAGTTGNWEVVNWQSMYYPRHRRITKITQATQAVVTLSVTHGYKVGQAIRFNVPAAFGMTQMDGLVGNIVAIDTTTTTGNTVTVDIDSSAFTAFTFPLTAAVPFSPALTIPVGMDTALALADSVDILSDATYNTAYTGMILGAGANGPAGQNNDVIYWVAGSSFSVNNL